MFLTVDVILCLLEIKAFTEVPETTITAIRTILVTRTATDATIMTIVTIEFTETIVIASQIAIRAYVITVVGAIVYQLKVAII